MRVIITLSIIDEKGLISTTSDGRNDELVDLLAIGERNVLRSVCKET